MINGQPIELTCAKCGCKKIRKYRRSRSHTTWLCLKCAMKKCVQEGKIKPNPGNLPNPTQASINSKLLWQDLNYRHKILSKRKAHKPKTVGCICNSCNNQYMINRRYSLRRGNRLCRSCALKLRWNSHEYRKVIAASASKHSKLLWQDTEYRMKVTASNSTTWSKRIAELSERSLKLWQDPEYRQSILNSMANHPRISNLQIKLYQYLDDLGIVYHKENEQTIIGPFVFDCLIPNRHSKHILIECQGDYWHTLPNNVKRDRAKFIYINRYFPDYEIMYIWEHEFYTKDRVLDRLKLKLGLNVETASFNFGEIVLKPATSNELKSFLDSYHYIGKDRGGSAFAAYHNNHLVGCVVYSNPIRQNISQQFSTAIVELSRFCIHPNYHKKNFASWLISRTIKMMAPQTIIAYADTTVGHTGTIYKASNFKHHHTVAADYWYTDKAGWVMHKRTLYGRAVKMSLTEAKYAETYGYTKKYGGEKLCFVYN